MSKVNTMNLVTTKTLESAFGVSAMTIYNWRCQERNPMPVIRIPGNDKDAIRFDPESIVKWAESSNKTLVSPNVLKK